MNNPSVGRLFLYSDFTLVCEMELFSIPLISGHYRDTFSACATSKDAANFFQCYNHSANLNAVILLESTGYRINYIHDLCIDVAPPLEYVNIEFSFESITKMSLERGR